MANAKPVVQRPKPRGICDLCVMAKTTIYKDYRIAAGRGEVRRFEFKSKVKDARLKKQAAVTISKATSKAKEPAGRRRCQHQRRAAEAGRYRVNRSEAIHHGTCLIQPIQMASERARARITAQLSSESSGAVWRALALRLSSSAICDSPWCVCCLLWWSRKQKARSTAGGLLAGLKSGV
jgi:hypothetical protein